MTTRRTPRIFHQSAGAVVVSGGRCLVVRRGHEWFFPKGHLERDESPAEAAVREVQEETGLVVRLVRELGATRYGFGDHLRHRKRVEWFLAQPVGGTLTLEAGFDDAAWLSPAEAVQTLNHAGDREIAALAFEPADPEAPPAVEAP